MQLKQAITVLAGIFAVSDAKAQCRKTCVVEANGTNKTDDGPAIKKAFEECGRNGRVVLKPTTYYVNSVLNITDLDDVEVDWQGTLLVG